MYWNNINIVGDTCYNNYLELNMNVALKLDY